MVRYTLGLFSNMYPPEYQPSPGTVTHDTNRGIFVKRMVDDLEEMGVVVRKAVKTSGSVLGYPAFLLDSAVLARDRAVDILQAEYIPHSSIIPVLCKRKDIPLILKFHGDDARIFPFKNPFNRSLTLLMIRRAAHIITSSQEIRRILIGIGADPARTTVIHTGVDTDFFSPYSQIAARSELDLPKQKTIFVFVGRLHPLKGIPEIMQVAGVCPEISFVLIGPGRIPVHPANCLFTGSLAPEKVRAWLRAADCMILPTHTEAVPTSVMEAFACGIPAVTTDIGGCPEIVNPGRNGLMVPVCDVPALRDAVMWIHSHPAEREAMGRDARETVVRQYDHRVLIEKLISLHTTILGSGKS